MDELTPDGPTAHHFTAKSLAITVAAYTALTIVYTHPLLLHLSSAVPKDLGDPLLATAILWWNAHVLPLTERWWNGFGFFPAPGMMAFSEHFLGASLIASPLQWIGLSAVTAYNVTFLASFVLCGISAHALAYTLTRRHDAAAVCGVAYAFNPYRVAHVEHLELLLAFGMPAALAFLHLYAQRLQVRWLVAFAVALTLQVLSGSYYALFFTVLLGLWLLWFLDLRAWQHLLAILAAAGAAALSISPVVLGYRQIHADYNVTREFADEVLKYSADLSSFVTASPLSAVWGWTAYLNGGERQLFPGVTIVLLSIAGACLLHRSFSPPADRLTTVARVSWGIAAACAALATRAWLVGPWHLEWGWLTVSVSVAYKPWSLSLAFALVAVALSARFRAAYHRRSVLAFYLIAAFVLFLCSLGPKPALFGEQLLYEPPYAWLMRLPFFDDTIRVPARFGMLGILSLSVAASLAFTQLVAFVPRARWVSAAVLAAILADGWMAALPLPPVPRRGFEMPRSATPAAVLELPLGDVWRDTAALYRATLHQRPAVNGYNGYEPSYYQALRRALNERDPTILDALAASGPLLIAADTRVAPQAEWATFLSQHQRMQRVTQDGEWSLFWLPAELPQPQTAGRCTQKAVPIVSLSATEGFVDPSLLTDEDPGTRWSTLDGQTVGDALTVDLGRPRQICGLMVSLGAAAALYPEVLSVATSPDGATWHTRFQRTMGGAAFRAAVQEPADAHISIPLEPHVTRFIRLRVERSQPLYPWAVADVWINGGE